MGNAAATPLRVLLAPPIPWLPYRESFVPGSGPDPMLLERLLAAEGVAIAILDPDRGWRNPFRGRHPVLQGIDPWRALRILASHRRFDVVVSVFEGAAIPLALLRNAARLGDAARLGGAARLGPALVLWDIGLTENWRLRERLQDFVVPRVDGIMVLGANQQAAIARRWPRHGRVTVIGHLVDTGFYRPAAFAPPDGPVLGVGDDAGRDYPTLLDAVRGTGERLVLRTGTALALGSGHERVEILRERLPYAGLRALYEAAAFVVLPLAETQNASGVSAILEAGAMGRAVIVSRSSGIADYARDGETCLVVPRHDPDAMRAAIGRLRREPETAARLGAAARRFVLAEHSTEAFARRFAAALRGYAADRAAGVSAPAREG